MLVVLPRFSTKTTRLVELSSSSKWNWVVLFDAVYRISHQIWTFLSAFQPTSQLGTACGQWSSAATSPGCLYMESTRPKFRDTWRSKTNPRQSSKLCSNLKRANFKQIFITLFQFQSNLVECFGHWKPAAYLCLWRPGHIRILQSEWLWSHQYQNGKYSQVIVNTRPLWIMPIICFPFSLPFSTGWQTWSDLPHFRDASHGRHSLCPWTVCGRSFQRGPVYC